MLSPGKDHLLVPNDPEENVAFRIALLEACEADPVLAAGVIEICKRDIVFYVNVCIWQYNPLKLGHEVGPFILWEHQKAAFLDGPDIADGPGLLWCYEHSKDLVLEKSREEGATWILLIMQDWFCRFHDRQKWLDISRSADAVDAPGDSDSLFWKLDFIQEHLPPWLGGVRNRGEQRKSMFIDYPVSRSIVTGQASTGSAGVSGRASGIIIDEFPRIKEDREVRQGTASTGRCRFFCGTHLGTHTEFYRLTKEILKRVIHWTQHPEKNKGLYSYDTKDKKLRFWEYVPGDGFKELAGPKYLYASDFDFDMTGRPTGGPYPGIRSPWYDEQAKKIGTTRGVAMELDIDPEQSVSTPFDPLAIARLRSLCRPPDWEGDLKFDSRGQSAELLKVDGGPVKLWCKLIDGKPPRARYTAGADVSGGTGASPSCLSLANGATGQKVFEYVNAHMPPDVFGIFAAAVCRLFCDKEGEGARIVWEHAGPGVSFAKGLIECGYRNLAKTAPDNRVGRFGKIIAASLGWNPTKESKNLMLKDYKLGLENGEFLNLSEHALKQCMGFRYGSAGEMIHSSDDTDNPEAARENHGDIVIADGLCWKVVKDLGVLVSRLKQEEAEDPPELSVFTVVGRHAMRERLEQMEVW